MSKNPYLDKHKHKTNDHHMSNNNIIYYSVSFSLLILFFEIHVALANNIHNIPNTPTISRTNIINASADNRVMHIVLDIFSGRPNPSLMLTPEQTTEFLKMISLLKPIEKNPTNQHDGLGYRGFTAKEKSNNAGLSKEFKVYNGKVRVVVGNDTVSIFEDKDYILERWLLKIASDNVENDLIKVIQQEIKNRPN